MKYLSLVICLFWVGFVTPANAQNLPPVAPKQIQSEDLEVGNSLSGWIAEKRSYAKNRIVYRKDGYKSARVLSFQTSDLDAVRQAAQFDKAVQEALQLEGVKALKITAKSDVKGDVAIAFQENFNIVMPRVWLAIGQSDDGPVKVAGISMLSTPASGDPGLSVEVFVATKHEYEAMGGSMTLMARLFDFYFKEPSPATILGTGQAKDPEVIQFMSDRFEEFMAYILVSYGTAGILTEQTRAIAEGYNQSVPYGLQNPMYAWK